MAGVSLGGGAVILLLAVLAKLTRGRYGARWRCWAWLLLALRLAVPLPLLPAGAEAAPIQIQVPPDRVIYQPVRTPRPSLPQPIPAGPDGGANPGSLLHSGFHSRARVPAHGGVPARPHHDRRRAVGPVGGGGDWRYWAGIWRPICGLNDTWPDGAARWRRRTPYGCSTACATPSPSTAGPACAVPRAGGAHAGGTVQAGAAAAGGGRRRGPAPTPCSMSWSTTAAGISG